MSPAAALNDAVAMLEESVREQRSRRRYSLKLDVEYKLLNDGQVLRQGSGRIANISSTGLFFETDGLLPIRNPIELAIDWPILLDGACRLKMIVHGSVLRSDRSGTAVGIIRHEFRTTKRSANKSTRVEPRESAVKTGHHG